MNWQLPYIEYAFLSVPMIADGMRIFGLLAGDSTCNYVQSKESRIFTRPVTGFRMEFARCRDRYRG
jgi:hypothetical protein